MYCRVEFGPGIHVTSVLSTWHPGEFCATHHREFFLVILFFPFRQTCYRIGPPLGRCLASVVLARSRRMAKPARPDDISLRPASTCRAGNKAEQRYTCIHIYLFFFLFLLSFKLALVYTWAYATPTTRGTWARKRKSLSYTVREGATPSSGLGPNEARIRTAGPSGGLERGPSHMGREGLE